MGRWAPTAILLALWLSPPAAAVSGAEGETAFGPAVAVLTADIFDMTTASGTWFVMFFAPWCGHCQRLKPEFGELGAALAGSGEPSALRLGAVDCTAEKALCEQRNARSFPTFRYYADRAEYDYSGGRELAAWKAFAERLLRPTVIPLDSAEAVQRFIDPTGRTVNFVWYVPTDSSELNDVMRVNHVRAAAYEGTRFGRAASANVLPHFQADLEASKRGLVVYNDIHPLLYDGPWTADAVGDWVEAHRFLKVEEMSHTAFYSLSKRRRLMGLLLCDAKTMEDYDFGRPALQAVAATPEGARFILGRMDATVWEGWLTRFGIALNQAPYFFVVDPTLELYYRNDTHAELIQAALRSGGPAAALIGAYLQLVTAGAEPERAAGLKGHLNRITKTYFPSMLGYLEEMQVALLLLPVLFLSLLGMLVFFFFPAEDAPHPKRQ